MVASIADGIATGFEQHGYAVLESLTTVEDIAQVRRLLDPLFDRFDSLGERAFDLAGPLAPGAAPKSPEVNEAAVLEPRLRETLTYARCREVARRLLGVPVGYQFDHAIYKTPQNQTPTAWHQDEAYNREPIPLRSIHFWDPAATGHRRERLHVVHPRLASRRGCSSTASPAGAARAVRSQSSRWIRAMPSPARCRWGGATIHHPLTLHYTGANQSTTFRRAWILHFGAYGKIRHLLHPKSVAGRMRNWVPRRHLP